MARVFSIADVQSHNRRNDLYLIIHGKVYDTSSFLDEHPGGSDILLEVGGKDATEAYDDAGHSEEAHDILKGLFVGTLKEISTSSKDAKINLARALDAHVMDDKGASSRGGGQGFLPMISKQRVDSLPSATTYISLVLGLIVLFVAFSVLN